MLPPPDAVFLVCSADPTFATEASLLRLASPLQSSRRHTCAAWHRFHHHDSGRVACILDSRSVSLSHGQSHYSEGSRAMVEAPEVPHHHHHTTGVPWFDLIVPLAVLCISIASLLTSLQSEKSMHALVEQNTRLVSAQSTPLLMLDSSNLDSSGKRALSMTLSNVGTGPAQIGWFRIADAHGLSYSGGTLYERVAKLDPKASFTSQQISVTLMRSGEERSVFSWPRPPTGSPASASWEELNLDRFALHASACYCSIFEECKITEFGSSHPRPVPSCDESQGGRVP